MITKKTLPKWVEEAAFKHAIEVNPGSDSAERCFHESVKSFKAGVRLILDRAEATEKNDFKDTDFKHVSSSFINSLNEARAQVRKEISGDE